MKVLEYTRDRVQGDPLKCNEIVPTSENLESSEFRRIVCRGIFDEDNSIYVGPRSRSISGVTENGYYLITPLMPNPGDPESIQLPILVNRGWVPRSWRDKSIEVSENSMKPSNISTTPKQETAKDSASRPLTKSHDLTLQDQAGAASSVEVLGVNCSL
ncbi:hypothetical protein Leryth_027116 [Lithospermum erythrorhizon]|nr:hypothetical protein Leryth_027116 [Lithospermum erythrorhizon]